MAFVSIKDVVRKTSLSASTIRRLEETDPTFPKLHRLTTRRTVFDLAAIEAWLAAKTRGGANDA
jgi:predicted DNA-binding transcriptional regulator AlpA